MAYQEEVHAAKLDGPELIPGTHTAEGENLTPQVVL